MVGGVYESGESVSIAIQVTSARLDKAFLLIQEEGFL